MAVFFKANLMFDLDKYIGKQQRRNAGFLEFMYCFARALVGMHEWKQCCEIDDFSKIVTVSDKVYLYAILEGNSSKWMKKYQDKVKMIVIGYRYFILILTVCFAESQW